MMAEDLGETNDTCIDLSTPTSTPFEAHFPLHSDFGDDVCHEVMHWIRTTPLQIDWGQMSFRQEVPQCNSFIENSSALKKPQAKLKKMHNLGHKNNNPPKEPQPKRVEEVYRALKSGLDEYLEVHQTELDKLTAQLKDMKRNSRLGVLYDLDKQMKTIERYMRRLEFHISKVDELYEAYCIQRRLQDGASKMKQAFATSPASKAARESLAEISRSYKEYTEV
ncbi:Rho -interacting cell polarization regulator 2 [Saguinus oedipus]|uniref:Rho family-interacting cell polarization regulator 2 n=1 Tax=Saguinus oedipus TaxID=9490 RepID=A0ABQ9VU03_SAGOE|nr:Rho -interacting cell polarization regulator 2 [Saguinus oedipus]